MKGAWYNENDPNAAAWLRELIGYGFLPDGGVRRRFLARRVGL